MGGALGCGDGKAPPLTVLAHTRGLLADRGAVGQCCGLIMLILQAKAVLAATQQFQINLGQQFGIEQGTVIFPPRIIDTETAAQSIKAGGRAGEFHPRHFQRVDHVDKLEPGMAHPR